ncbi:hypothetical protein V2O64_01245 [Verrucomicrobiaceae bacterium 227]
MRQLRATFLLLLFITSFARCWADSSGLLTGSPLACCESLEEQHQDPDGKTRHEKHDQEDDENEVPLNDCPTCVMVKAGFTAGLPTLDLPTPYFVDLNQEWHEMLTRIEDIFSTEECLHLEAPVTPERGSVLVTSRIVTTSAISVRGPNLV